MVIKKLGRVFSFLNDNSFWAVWTDILKSNTPTNPTITSKQHDVYGFCLVKLNKNKLIGEFLSTDPLKSLTIKLNKVIPYYKTTPVIDPNTNRFK